MGRRRAGHGHTSFFRGNRHIDLLFDSAGRLIPTGVAKNWARCSRCRKPEDQMPEDSGLCVNCFYSIKGDGHWFWSRKDDYLFPYKIGERFQANNARFDRRPLSDPKIDWRQYLKSQQNGIA